MNTENILDQMGIQPFPDDDGLDIDEREYQPLAKPLTYQFTSEQLGKLLQNTCAAYGEYREQHGKDEETAAACAIGEILDGMTAERELQADGVELEPSHTLVSEVTDGFLRDLRKRLELVKRRIETNTRGQYIIEQEGWNHDRQVEHYMACGENNALRDEQLFLAGMIAEIERVSA